jgi:alkylation response protein AidB-like acyl-CoA dehydrogenase
VDPREDQTAEQQAFRTEVRAELGRRLARRVDRDVPSIMGAGSDDLEAGRAFLATLAEGGLAAPTWPLEYGGMGATPEQAAIVNEELAAFERPDLYPFMVGISLVGPTVLTHGNDVQKDRWLPAIRSGEEIWCQLFSEPDAGSDLAGLLCRAERDGDGWRVTGTKVWSSRAHYARWGLLLARTDRTVPKHAGITAFALDMTAPGVEVRPLRQMNGDMHFNEVFLTDAWIDDDSRIGAEGEGWRVAITTLMHERGSIGGGYGVSRDQIAGLGRSPLAGPVERDRLASVLADLEVARFTGLRAKAAAQAGRPPGPEGSGGKLRMSATLKTLAGLALDVAGPAGMLAEGEWQTLFLTGPSLSIRGGTDEIQRNILGERVLGLPPEPREDKNRPFAG